MLNVPWVIVMASNDVAITANKKMILRIRILPVISRVTASVEEECQRLNRSSVLVPTRSMLEGDLRYSSTGEQYYQLGAVLSMGGALPQVDHFIPQAGSPVDLGHTLCCQTAGVTG
jgi:hypothetical protein